MTTVKNHWITALSLAVSLLLVAMGIGVLFGDFDSEAWRVAYSAGSILGALAIVGGLWGLRTGRLRHGVADSLIVVGVVVFGAGYWWLVFVPPVLALLVVYVGVIRNGLERELHPV